MEKRGSLVVEAAIFLPIFILCMLSLSAIVKAAFLQTSVYECLSDEIKNASLTSYAASSVGKGLNSDISSIAVNITGAGTFSARLSDGLKQRGVDSSAMKVKSFASGVSKFGYTHLMCADTQYCMKLGLPAGPVNELYLKNTVYYRAWDGEDFSSDVFSFDRMKADENGDVVYVFPDSGEKYHNEGCRYVNSYAISKTASNSVFDEYAPCPLCMKGGATYGQTVYVFKYGACYHSSECSSVTKYTIEMDHDDALKKGYCGCSICGG